MWPFKKGAKQPEAKIEGEKPQQDYKLQMIIDPETRKVSFKPKLPESPAKERENPLIIKLECPTCKKSLDRHQSKQSLERTSRNKFKCPHCRNWIYFLGDNPVTQEDHERLVEKYYATRHQERLHVTMTEELGKTGLTEEKLKRREQDLLAKMGVQPQRISVILSLFSETILNVKDLNEKAARYFDLANTLHKGGEDSFPILQVAAKTKLAALEKEGYKNVSISTIEMCEACKKLNGKVISIDQALKTMPIPIRTCKHRSEDEKYAFCICEYMGEVDDEYMMNMK